MCPDWYPGAPVVDLRRLDARKIHDFCRQMDAMLFFETPFSWPLLPWCADNGIRTYLVPMYECHPLSAPRPHKYLCPSLLDMDYFPSGTFLPLPVDYPWTQRYCAVSYLHNGGYLGLRGREGTTLLIEAMRHVKSPLSLTIRVQENVKPEYQVMAARDKRIDYVPLTVPYEELYATADVCVQPQKFNGCSLPLQEACAAGLLVMTTDRYPMNTWLPKGPLIPVAGYDRGVSIGPGYLRFDEARVEPRDVAATMDAWYGRDVSEFSLAGKRWAEEHSWEVLKPRWLEALSS